MKILLITLFILVGCAKDPKCPDCPKPPAPPSERSFRIVGPTGVTLEGELLTAGSVEDAKKHFELVPQILQ